MLLDELEIRKTTLERIIAQAENFVETKKTLDKYTLRVENKRARTYYYLREGTENNNGKLISSNEIKFAQDVAQLCYNKKIITDAKKRTSYN